MPIFIILLILTLWQSDYRPLTSPPPILVSSANGDDFIAFPLSLNFKTVTSKIDSEVDELRQALELLERFNIMEETYGADWPKTFDHKSASIKKCTLGNIITLWRANWQSSLTFLNGTIISFDYQIHSWITVSCADYANDHKLQQDHPCVIEIIRQHYLHKPASIQEPYNLKRPAKFHNPSDGPSQAILQLLRNQVLPLSRILAFNFRRLGVS